MKVYDCFTFYNEFELLELRLKALWDVVDCFVIVEADKTHTNQPKPFQWRLPLVEESIRLGRDIYGRYSLSETQLLPFDARKIRLPHVDEFLRKYPHFLREPEKYFGT